MAETIDTSAIEALGYAVETTGTESAPYRVTGRRGAEYLLIRNYEKPNMLFPMGRTNVNATLKGYTWFVEKDGVLRPLR